jgi:hypothetical protein
MSRDRRAKKPGGRPRTPEARPPVRRRRRYRSPALLALALVLVLAAAVWMVQRRALNGVRSGAELPDSLDQLTPQQLFLRQRALFYGTRPTESLIYARRLSERVPGNWQAHLNYSIALNAAAMEARPGATSTRTRASVERVAMLRHAFEELDMADRCTSLPRGRSAIELQRGDLYRIWGFPTDAFEAYRNGLVLDPSFDMARERFKLATHAMLHPGAWSEPNPTP